MKRSFALLAAGAACAATTTSGVNALVLSKPFADQPKSAAQIKKLETIMAGMKKVMAVNGQSDNKIGATLSPFVSEVEGMLKEVSYIPY